MIQRGTLISGLAPEGVILGYPMSRYGEGAQKVGEGGSWVGVWGVWDEILVRGWLDLHFCAGVALYMAANRYDSQ